VILPNVLGTYHTLETARTQSVEGYLYFSSAEVYGNLQKDIITEDDCGCLEPFEVRSCYAESKRLAETLCASYKHQYGVPVSVARIAHAFGPTMDIFNDSRVFSEFTANAVAGQDIVMKSDGSPIRTFCYISDLVRANFLILLSGSGVYNVTNTNARCSILELANMISEIVCEAQEECGLPAKRISVSASPREQGGGYLENKIKIHPQISTDKLMSLGWRPQVSVRDGFKRVISHFLLQR
jgi:nucleoside-diphosphate-sugar epimerase